MQLWRCEWRLPSPCTDGRVWSAWKTPRLIPVLFDNGELAAALDQLSAKPRAHSWPPCPIESSKVTFQAVRDLRRGPAQLGHKRQPSQSTLDMRLTTNKASKSERPQTSRQENQLERTAASTSTPDFTSRRSAFCWGVVPSSPIPRTRAPFHLQHGYHNASGWMAFISVLVKPEI